MDRRSFFCFTAAASAGLLAKPKGLEASVSPTPSHPKQVLMHVGTQRGAIRLDNPESGSTLSFFKRHGVDNICAFPRSDAWSVENLSRLRELVESHGISLDMVDMPLARTPLNPIMMGKSPERDRDIEEVCLLIRNCAAVGIPSIKYYLSLLPILSTGRTPGRGGSSSRTWRLADYKEADQLTEAGPVPAELMWERITYFLKKVIPVAEEHKIRMACHPHDVPTPPDFRGIDQVMGTPEGLKRFVAIQESPYHGLNLCLGTTAEMLQDPRNEIFPIIRYFGVRKKIFNIHFRNIRGVRDDFLETYPDDGDMDMAQVALTLKEVEYPYMVMPDHIPSHPDDPGTLQGFAYAYGYIKGIIQLLSHFP